MFKLKSPLARTTRFLQTARTLHTHNATPGRPKSVLKSRFLLGVKVGLGVGVVFGIAASISGNTNKKIGLDSLPDVISKVDLQAPTDSKPFPAQISINKVPFQAIATGVRTVTFLNFHVYAVGLYIASEDISLTRKILSRLSSKYAQDGPINWRSVLADETSGYEVIDTLLRENIRFAVRISPTRNTDYGHLRDGFVRSVLNHKESKSLQTVEFGQSIAEIKRAFGRKRKLTKGEVITWSRDINGGMTAWYGETDESKELLGSPSHPDVARLFFLQYLTGNKPNSPTLKDNAVKTLADIADAS